MTVTASRVIGTEVAPPGHLLRPGVFAALTVALACVPQGHKDGAFSVAVADVAAVGLVAAAAVTARASLRPLSRRVWILAPPVLAVTAATLASPDAVTSLTGFVRFLEVFAIIPLAVVLVIRDRAGRRLLMGTVLAVALVQALVGLWQTATGSGASYAGEPIRAVGTFGAVDVMGMATLVSYGLVVALAVALTCRGRRRGLAILALCVLVPALTASLSRGAWVACLVAAAAMTVLSGWRTAVRVALVGAAAGVLATVIGMGSPTLAERMTSLMSSTSQPDQSVTDRYGLWEAAVGMWRHHSLLGVGPRGFAEQRDGYAPVHVSAGSDTADPVNGFQRQPLLSPHNMYLLVLSEQGLVGLTAFCALGGGLAVWACLAVRRRRTAASLTAAGFVAWQLTDFVYADPGGPPTVVTAVMIGLALSTICDEVRP
ncbi:O-antigen ligase family protein [Thermoactinospora rubra]|uniref:O-antigen ligase family protein n=1 Tax=Thermoactinospora rubra TaxID=1088767 RepID=UPI000A112B98|nr:O-antigen ligase family protein [Thermoactinospora rubra]